MKQIIQCVPNFSEGRDPDIIRRITEEIEKTDGVKLLDTDPGKATNRTVVTFAGEPEPVVEAAFRSIRKACELIDMSRHQGAHPRFGAADVCPLIPISNITMEETAEYARKLAERAGSELKIPVYCYEYAAFSEDRRNLADVRAGEYEGLQEKLTDPLWKPDYGPSVFKPEHGALAVGARKILVAFNVNLNTTSVRRANAVAFDVREMGRAGKDGSGGPVRIPGSLKHVKGIGWYLEEYGICQISMNLTDTSVTPVHTAFTEVCEKAWARGLRVTGSEIVGLLPLHDMLEAGRFFLRKQNRSAGVPDRELIRIAVKSMGLDELAPFRPEEKIIEYALEGNGPGDLAGMPVMDFIDETASESPAPGGGSVSALLGALGAALGTMVANLSSHKRGWDSRCSEFSSWAETGRKQIDALTVLIDEDTAAFNRIMTACGMTKSTAEERTLRKSRIEEATKYAIQVPLQVMKAAHASLDLIRAMAETGNPASVSDAGVGAVCAAAAVRGAELNVRINAAGLTDRKYAAEVLSEAELIEKRTIESEAEILSIVRGKIS